jgi:hypothetical protein
MQENEPTPNLLPEHERYFVNTIILKEVVQGKVIKIGEVMYKRKVLDGYNLADLPSNYLEKIKKSPLFPIQIDYPKDGIDIALERFFKNKFPKSEIISSLINNESQKSNLEMKQQESNVKIHITFNFLNKSFNFFDVNLFSCTDTNQYHNTSICGQIDNIPTNNFQEFSFL